MNQEKAFEATTTKKSLPMFLKTLIILVISGILLVSAFLPIVSYSTDEFEGMDLDETLTINMSPVRNVVLMFDSFANKDNEDIADSDLADEVNDLLKDLEDEIEADYDDIEISSKGMRMISKMVYLELRMGLQSEDNAMRIPFIISSFASLAYIALVIVLFVFALLNFLAYFGGKEVNIKKTVMFLCAIPAALILNYFATANAMYGVYMSQIADGELGVGTVLGIVFSVLAIAALITFAFVFDRVKFNLKRYLVRIGVLVVAFVALMSVFMPLSSVSLEGKFAGRNSKTKVSVMQTAGYFGALAATDDEKDAWDKAYDNGEFEKDSEGEWTDSFGYLSTLNAFAGDEVKEYRNGDNQQACDNRLTYLFAIDGGYKMFTVMNFIPLLLLIMGAGFGMIMMYQLYLLITNEEKTAKGTKLISLVSVIAAVLVLALVICFIIMTTSDLDHYMGKKASDNVKVDFGLSVGVGSVLAVLLGAVLMVANYVPALIGLENSQKQEPASEEEEAAPAEEKAEEDSEQAEAEADAPASEPVAEENADSEV